MHTVELLDQAIALAERLGYQIRQEWLGGSGGGVCEFNGNRWIFIDLALNIVEQLEQVSHVLRSDPGVFQVALSGTLARHLGVRQAA